MITQAYIIAGLSRAQKLPTLISLLPIEKPKITDKERTALRNEMNLVIQKMNR